MANISVGNIQVPRIARNKRVYPSDVSGTSGGGFSASLALDWVTVTETLVEINRDLNVTGKITATEEVWAHVSGAVQSNVLAGLSAQLPLYKINDSTVGLHYGTGLTTDANGNLIIDGDTFNLTNYYTKTNLQTSGQAAVHWGNITNFSLASSGLTDGDNLAKLNASNPFTEANLFGGIRVNGNVKAANGVGGEMYYNISSQTFIVNSYDRGVTNTFHPMSFGASSFSFNANISTTGQYQVNGSQISSSDLADGSTIWKSTNDGPGSGLNADIVSGYGIGVNSPNKGSADVNSIITNGLYYIQGGINAPGGKYGQLLVNCVSSSYGMQEFTEVTGARNKYIRTLNSGYWGSWFKIWNTGNSNLSTVDWAANNMNVAGQYQVNGTQISSSNLLDGSNLAKLNANNPFTGVNTFSGGSYPIKINGTATGISNTAYIPFYESNGNARQAYIGLGSGSTNVFYIDNDITATQIRLGSTLAFYSGGVDNTIWHSGNSNLSTVDWSMKDAYINGITLKKDTSNDLNISSGMYVQGNASIKGTTKIYNSSGVLQWSIELDTSNNLLFKNASGVKEMKLTQAGDLSCVGEVSAHISSL